MYAVVSSGGKQYRIEPGSTIVVERLALASGASITFDRVLLIGDGDEVTVGKPLVSGVTVRGTVLGDELGGKLRVFKFKQKVKYRRMAGHRQQLTRIRIDAIDAGKAAKERQTKGAEGSAPSSPASSAPAAPSAPARRRRSAAPPDVGSGDSSAESPAAPREARPRRRSRAAGAAAGTEKGGATGAPKDDAREPPEGEREGP